MRRLTLLMGSALLVGATPLAAQAPVGEWQIAPHAVLTRYDGTSAIERSAGVGVQALYFLTERIGIGPRFDFSRTRSDGSFFPALQWNIGPDSSRLMLVGQELSIISIGGRGEVHQPFAYGRVFGAAGAGIYSIYLDPQSSGGGDWFTRPALEIGAGVDLDFNADMGLRVEARDFVMTRYERDRLRAVDERFESTHFVRPDVPAPKSTLHNLILLIGFTYTP